MPRVKKADRFRMQEFVNRSGSRSWRVTGTRPDGTRVRRNFTAKSEALTALAKEEETAAGSPGKRRMLRTSLSSEKLSDAEAASRAGGDRQLSGIVSRLLDVEGRAAAKGLDLDAAMAFFEAHYREEIRRISILNARDAFVGSRVGISTRTLRGYQNSTALLLRPDPNKLIHQITVTDIEGILSRFRNLNTKRTHQRVFNVFFNWAVRHHHCLENPCSRLDRIPQSPTPIAILSLDEVRRLLTAAVRYRDGLTAAAVAIALFAGLRPGELADLRPEDINNERIRVRGGKLRRKLNRTVPVPPNLAVWLKRFPFRGLPPGWDHKLKVLKAATGAKKWVQDILRHTSITYQAERDRNEGLTAFNNGTSKAMMDRHYRDVLDNRKDVDAYWALTPVRLPRDINVKLPCQQDVDWPPNAKLKKLVWRTPMVHLAKEIGVSDVALKKHCVKNGIELPPRGHWLKDAAERQS